MTSDSCNSNIKCPFFVSLKGANIMCQSVMGTKFKYVFEKTDGLISSQGKAKRHLKKYCYEIQDIDDPNCCPLFIALWRLWESEEQNNI